MIQRIEKKATDVARKLGMEGEVEADRSEDGDVLLRFRRAADSPGINLHSFEKGLEAELGEDMSLYYDGDQYRVSSSEDRQAKQAKASIPRNVKDWFLDYGPNMIETAEEMYPRGTLVDKASNKIDSMFRDNVKGTENLVEAKDLAAWMRERLDRETREEIREESEFLQHYAGSRGTDEAAERIEHLNDLREWAGPSRRRVVCPPDRVGSLSTGSCGQLT